MKIIDSHMHFGKSKNLNLTEADVDEYMIKNNIIYGCISNIAGSEFTGKNNVITELKNPKQIQVNSEMMDFCNKRKGKLSAFFWIKPHKELYSNAIKDFINNNKESFVGMKIHPKKSRLIFSDENYRSYIKMCEELKLPIIIHTSKDIYCDVNEIYKVANKYKTVKFILVHMGLKTDHLDYINLIREVPNLYGDTTLVDIPSVVKAIRECGSEKILFGTDSPCFKRDKWQEYIDMLNTILKEFTNEECENVMFNNANRIFKLNL